ncbi:type I polyketide synthase [Penicillium longicatenatum]|nr:type I polyketide synthase [Penicillium longicatenatum]
MAPANYSAGNFYEDALARYETALVLLAVTINLGAVNRLRVKLLSKASTLTEAVALLVQAIKAKIAQIFNIPLLHIDAELPMSRYGVEFVVAVELRNWLSSDTKAKVTLFEIVQNTSLNELGALVVSNSEELTSKELPA